ncbi:MAG: hypothetical protein WBD63_02535 [Phycisphaerae bacterium]|nr:hypothetical protein [Phycisphaerae bacterium]
MASEVKPPFDILCDEKTGQVASVRLYGQDLLDPGRPCESELWVNGHPLPLRPHVDPNQPAQPHLKGERFVNQFSGWGLVLARTMGQRLGLKHQCYGVHTHVRRELCDQTYPVPGPGGPVVEAPLWVDTFSILNWNWKFWGEDTRMIFASSHSNGPTGEWGHCGYENDTPETCKGFLQNIWRRIYPGCLVIHGGLFYNIRTGHWLAITCRQPHVGYILNIEKAGRGVSYDFTLHAPFHPGDALQLPEVKFYWGADRPSMMSWMGDYVTHYYQEPPEWVHKTTWGPGLGWNNQPTWTDQADFWEKQLDRGAFNGISYCLVTNRPIRSGTTPLGYEPDPNHGPIEEFRTMCRRIAARGVPILIWMSHSGLLYQGGKEIDDDWFIRGVDGRTSASWGNVDGGGMMHINPGHPGYIEYTKKWIRFYIKECGCKGIFFDCLSWAFPPDFKPRPFMRYPGDTNLMAVKFMQEVYACIKECDPDAIMLGEGASLEGPVNVFSINANPRRGIDGFGPRDFLLQLNQYAPKRMVLDQGPRMLPACGMCTLNIRPDNEALNRYLTRLLAERGGPKAFTHIPGDLSVMDNLLVVSEPDPPQPPQDVRLPEPWTNVVRLVDEISGGSVAADKNGTFQSVRPGVYRMETR